MITKSLQQHARKVDEISNLCADAARYDDLRVQGYLSRYLAIMSAAYVEIGTQEAFFEFARRRSSPMIADFVLNHVKRENSIDCRKISRILERFDARMHSLVDAFLSEDERNAINSLKSTRDQLAHGQDNGTSYRVIKAYFEILKDYPKKLLDVLEDSTKTNPR